MLRIIFLNFKIVLKKKKIIYLSIIDRIVFKESIM